MAWPHSMPLQYTKATPACTHKSLCFTRSDGLRTRSTRHTRGLEEPTPVRRQATQGKCSPSLEHTPPLCTSRAATTSRQQQHKCRALVSLAAGRQARSNLELLEIQVLQVSVIVRVVASIHGPRLPKDELARPLGRADVAKHPHPSLRWLALLVARGPSSPPHRLCTMPHARRQPRPATDPSPPD